MAEMMEVSGAILDLGAQLQNQRSGAKREAYWFGHQAGRVPLRKHQSLFDGRKEGKYFRIAPVGGYAACLGSVAQPSRTARQENGSHWECDGRHVSRFACFDCQQLVLNIGRAYSDSAARLTIFGGLTLNPQLA